MSAPERLRSLGVTREYHERTKHHAHRFAASLGYMDWATQPDPFRRYRRRAAPPLDLHSRRGSRSRATSRRSFQVGLPRRRSPLARSRSSSATALALSAWKQSGSVALGAAVQPLQRQPSPDRGLRVPGPLAGLSRSARRLPLRAREHALELRAESRGDAWAALAAQLPDGAFLVGLSSIHWREAWKYGERAFRYCQHDVGHALAASRYAAAALGWYGALLDTCHRRRPRRPLGVQHPDRDRGGARRRACRPRIPTRPCSVDAARAPPPAERPDDLGESPVRAAGCRTA